MKAPAVPELIVAGRVVQHVTCEKNGARHVTFVEYRQSQLAAVKIDWVSRTICGTVARRQWVEIHSIANGKFIATGGKPDHWKPQDISVKFSEMDNWFTDGAPVQVPLYMIHDTYEMAQEIHKEHA